MPTIIRTPQGAFFKKTSAGTDVITDPRTLQSLFGGSLPYENVSDLQSLTPSPVSSPSPQGGPLNLSISPKQEDSNPLTKFNMIILDMLRNVQSGSFNEDLYKQRTALQRSAIGRGGEITPESLRVLSPSQQAAIRSGKVSALEPEIDAISAKIKSENERLQSFESLLKTAKDFGGEILKNVSPSKEIVEGYRQMIRAGGQPTSIPDEIRNKVLSSLTSDDWSIWSEQNRKGQTDQLSLYQQQMMDQRKITNFNTLATNYQKSPLVQAADRSVILKNVINDIKSNPSNSASQANLIYSYIQALDTYQSAVREGEIGFLQETSGIRDRLEIAASNLDKKKLLSNRQATMFADSAKRLTDYIDRAAKQKEGAFQSQAKVMEIGDLWSNFISGFSPSYSQTSQEKTVQGVKYIKNNQTGLWEKQK